ncbi:citryl-CoA lyase [Alteraurantiacibacter aestuarii]|uniref:citrate synthase (unknown stereospecificity) n=1 Tax=Alteraurantiacibacter aestuarii TaxID=650004 RepID=A0A844ZME2_9SPHN|nr:citryl-CoA lyase [Alteraurantiacibacter aestuarii]MXO88482.1 citryl-CoA lyase [Alteraurantiacibacter aestuarii]
MRIGKQDQPFSAICKSDATSITVRGRDLCGDIIGKMDFSSYFWLLVTGEEPNEDQSFFLNAVLCALAEHGLVPSVVAARMTLAAAPEAVQGAVAAGLLGCGSVVLGSAEVAGKFYAQCVADQRETGDDVADVAKRNIVELRKTTKAVPGFGHPQHSEGDPRANLLLKLADERGVSGEHVAMMRALQAALPETIGRELPVNVNGPIPAIMLDLGWPVAALKGIGLLCRTGGLIGHLTEEAERPIGFVLSGAAAQAIEYDGE